MKVLTKFREWHIFDPRLMVIGAGFLGIIMLTFVVIGVALERMNAISGRLDYVVHNLNARTAIISQVRENLYQRITSMRNMLLMTDVFEIDAEAQRFHGYGKHIEDDLIKLQKLLTEAEDKDSLDNFYKAATEGTRIHNEVIDLLLSGKNKAQIYSQLNQAFVAQKQVLESLQGLHIRYEDHGHILVDEALDEYHSARNLVYILGSFVVIIAIGISIIITRVLQHHMQEVENERLKFKALFDSSADAILILKGGIIKEWNQRAVDWLGQRDFRSLANNTIEQHSPAQQPDGRNSPDVWQEIITTSGAQNGGVFEWHFNDRNGNALHAEISITPLGSGENALTQLVIRDVTERWYAGRKMQYQATHDELTGLANRREFEKCLQESIEKARNSDSEHVLCLLDLDHFKQVNDIGGHDMGDELLRQITSLIKSKVRNHDTVARLGGDEFALILDDCPLMRAQQIAESICSAVSAYRLVGGGHIFQVGVSIGLAPISGSSLAMTQVMKLADKACYEAKNAGRGCIRVSRKVNAE
jgi:diguanylate cyclase (GGDEF)-like protein/PAS domain S-box-containing protein